MTNLETMQSYVNKSIAEIKADSLAKIDKIQEEYSESLNNCLIVIFVLVCYITCSSLFFIQYLK
jgi:hypothetical protein